MKTFEFLIFKPYEPHYILEKANPIYYDQLKKLKHANIEFPNGYSLSIVFGELGSEFKVGYGVGIFKDGERYRGTGYDRQCTTKEEVIKIISEIQAIRS